MKKILITITFCFICSLCFSQKTFSSENFVVETTDEFGENTGDIKVGVLAEGYFSNSATTNSCAQLVVSIMKESCWVTLYEYCRNHSSKDDFSVTFIGTKTKENLFF